MIQEYPVRGDHLKYLEINKKTTLSELADKIGDKNVEQVLAVNGLTRSPNIGKQFSDMCELARKSGASDNSSTFWRKKKTVLNTMTQDSDVFEKAAIMSDSDWNVMASVMTFPSTIRIPDNIELPDSTDILGNSVPIAKDIYEKAMSQLENDPHTIDPGIFNEFSTIKNSKIIDQRSRVNQGTTQFNIPWGKITLHSSISGDSIDLPCYPEEVEDSRKANYSTMPDIIYQYEPWYVFDSSGPRSNTYKIDAHRDMWTGDHRDGKANEMIRFFQSNLYADYNGSTVNTPIVTLYVEGSALITGIMTDVTVNWDGPIGLDGWYLHFTMTFSITEVSQKALNYNSVKQLPVIS